MNTPTFKSNNSALILNLYDELTNEFLKYIRIMNSEDVYKFCTSLYKNQKKLVHEICIKLYENDLHNFDYIKDDIFQRYNLQQFDHLLKLIIVSDDMRLINRFNIKYLQYQCSQGMTNTNLNFKDVNEHLICILEGMKSLHDGNILPACDALWGTPIIKEITNPDADSDLATIKLYYYGVTKNDDAETTEDKKSVNPDSEVADYCKNDAMSTEELYNHLFDDEEVNNEKSVISHPNHYCQNGIEVKDVIKAFTSDLEGAVAFDAGNIIKYACRWHYKNGIEDLMKCRQYIDMLISELETKRSDFVETYKKSKENK